jgi:predicted nucleic acid-binding protein
MGRSSAKLRRSPFTAYCRAGNVTLRPLPVRRSQMEKSFRPAICEVTIGELLAFAEAWGPERRALLEDVMAQMVVISISDRRIQRRWAEIYSHARASGWAIHQDHNDVWIAAAASISGLTLLSTDAAAFRRPSFSIERALYALPIEAAVSAASQWHAVRLHAERQADTFAYDGFRLRYAMRVVKLCRVVHNEKTAGLQSTCIERQGSLRTDDHASCRAQ